MLHSSLHDVTVTAHRRRCNVVGAVEVALLVLYRVSRLESFVWLYDRYTVRTEASFSLSMCARTFPRFVKTLPGNNRALEPAVVVNLIFRTIVSEIRYRHEITWPITATAKWLCFNIIKNAIPALSPVTSYLGAIFEYLDTVCCTCKLRENTWVVLYKFVLWQKKHDS